MRPISVDIKIFSKEYQAFHDAKQRCTNPKHKRYADWGGRGIKVLFNSFQEFLKELGPRPENCSLDRVNNDAHYETGNVKWSSREQQQHNKRVSCHNKSGLSGVRAVKARGLVTPSYQAFVHVNKKFQQLYTGPDFFEACCARKSFETHYEDI